MELYRLGTNDYDELIELLDGVFSRKNKREQHFEDDLPKMCVRDEIHMNRHLGIREDGRLVAVVGIYPLPTVVDGTPLLFSTVGNVATHPDCEGRGYMSTLMSAAMEELKRIGADGSRLGGSRNRYNRFGYESAGTTYNFTFTPENFKNKFKNFKTDLTLLPITADDTEALEYVWSLCKKNAICVNRLEMPNYADVYKSLCAWRCRPFMAQRPDGTKVGYLSADLSDNLAEWGAEDLDTAMEIFGFWQSKVNKELHILAAPYETEALDLFDRTFERVNISATCHFKIINYDKVVDAFLRLKTKIVPLPEGDFILGIKDYGNIKLTVKDNSSSCVRTEQPAELTLDSLAATRLLFGVLPAKEDIPAPVRAWLPLPLSWNLQDRV